MQTAKVTNRKQIGRPSRYRPEYCETAIALGRKGESFSQIALNLGISRRTLDNWRVAHPEFEEALELARDYCLAWWEDIAQANLTSSSWQGATWSRSMAARFPDDYRAVTRCEHAGVADAPPIRTESTTTVQLTAGDAYLAMMNRLPPSASSATPSPAPLPSAP